MSPRNGSSKSRSPSASPYSSRRTSVNPKSTRQQYSACGACRMRRVRCDLKDLPISGTGQHAPCSNCKERGLRCVDEFAEVKAVKLLRRGRRLQQVEAVYGKRSPDENTLYSVTPPPSVIPPLRPEFFTSPFFRRFHIQRPVIEPEEFRPRYLEFFKGNAEALQIPGQLIAMILVIWATSFGVTEYGQEEPFNGPADVRRNKERVTDMLQEVLYLIDVHGLLRKPSWDGVRALLLVIPLTQEVQTPMDRLTMYEATLSQVYTLCSLASVTTVNSGQGDYIDALVRARIFWYAHVTDGVTSGLRGGRVLLNDDDLASFEATLPHINEASARSAAYVFAYRFATIPIRISSICRKIHSALTGPKARQSNDVDEDKLRDAWEGLDRCWTDFNGLRHFGLSGILQEEDVERFIDSWQIFLFECLNVIREALKQRIVPRSTNGPFASTSNSLLNSGKYDSITRLHSEAATRCHRAVLDVVTILRRNLGSSFHQFDAALVRNGCFFAAFLLAGESGSREDVETCLQALGEMRWAFSKSEEREDTVKSVWESRLSQPRNHSQSTPTSPTDDMMRGGPSIADEHFGRRSFNRALSVPPLILPSIPNGFDSSSEPNTACTSDGRWPSGLSSSSGSIYSRPMSSHRSSSSTNSGSPPYLPPPQQLDLPSLPSIDPSAEPGGANSIYYFAPFNYVGMPGTSEASHQPSVLSSATTSDTPFSHNAPQFFDASSVVFSDATIVHPGTAVGTGGIPTPPGTGGDDTHLRSGVFYH